MTLQRTALWAIVVAATIYLLVAGRGLLLPFVLGLVLWYMVDALADAFEQPRIGRLRLPRPVALLAAVCVMGGLLWVVGRTIGRNISAVAAAAPDYERRLQILINEGARLVGVEQAPTLGELFDRISLADTLSSLATAAASVVSVAGIVLIYAGFLFVEQVRFRRKLAIILGAGGHQEQVLAVLDRIDRDIRVYIRIKTTLAVATAAFAYTVMAWVGVDFAAFWAVMVFFFYYIPTVGSILAIAAPAVLALVQSRPPDAVSRRVAGVWHHPDRDSQRGRAHHHGPHAQPLAAGRDRLAGGVGNDLGRRRDVPVRAHHGSGTDRPGAVQDHAAARRAAVGRRQDPGTPG